ncbi:hypothetical protein LCGC14_2191680 [marine sediment metagenome]|uniref:DUF169 domain-containing protein n=1 Tax=marine sediment metagenome TaxID=412755 RepID=A0A0F9FWT3_9ZZZZ
MTHQHFNNLQEFLDLLGLMEEPVGIFYTDNKPAEGFSPKPMDLPTREKEIKNEINWQVVFSQFSCVMGNIWRARKKKKAAYFSAEQSGCPGCAFWLGFMKPQTETIIHYVSTGIPDQMEGELYCDSPDELRRIQTYIDPKPASSKFCVAKPLSLFTGNEKPEVVSFFARPETMCGLHQLATFVTNDPEVVTSPWGAACTNLITWPFKYLARGENKAVLGGWDPSARKFFNTDELTFTVPYNMFGQMVKRFGESFLTTKTWATVQKKIARSNQAWTRKTERRDIQIK